MMRHNILRKYWLEMFIAFVVLWILLVHVWQPYYSNTDEIILHANDAVGKVISRHSDGAWHVDNDICNKKTDDFILTYLNKPPNTPIYVYPQDVDEYISTDLIYTGNYEVYNVVRLLEYMKRFPDAVFLDLGAFVGSFSLTMAALGYKVVAVECLHSNVARLCASMKMAKITDKLTIVYNALADTRTRVYLKTKPGNMGMTYVDFDKSLNESVDAIMLSDLLEIFPFSQVVMKMDVHFQEDVVLNGAYRFFKQVRVEALLLEFVHHQDDKYGNDGKFIVDFLNSQGMEPDVPDDIKHDYKQWTTTEILFKRKGS